jgi:hypothetical protein
MSMKAIKPLSTEENEPVVETQEAVSPAPLTTDQLLALLVTLQQQTAEAQKQAAEANKALAAAIVKTTEPREVIKTPKELATEANEELFKKNEKVLEARKKANTKYAQSLCDHVAGCSELSEQRDIAGRTSIIWHRNDVSVDIGVCTVCQRIFRPSDEPDEQGRTYVYWRKKPSFNKLSQAGGRVLPDIATAQANSYLHDS